MRGISVALTALSAAIFAVAPSVGADVLPSPLVFRFSRDGPGIMVCRDGKEFQCGTGCCGNDTVCFQNAACCPKGEKCVGDFIGKGFTQNFCKNAWEDGCPGSNICCPNDAPRCQEADFYGAGCWASTLDPRAVIPTATAPPTSAATDIETTTSCTEEETPYPTTETPSYSTVPVTTSAPITSSRVVSSPSSTDVKPTATESTVPTSTSREETPLPSTEAPSSSKTQFLVTIPVKPSPSSTVVHPTTTVVVTSTSSATKDISISLPTQNTSATESTSCEESLTVTVITSSTPAAPPTPGDKFTSSVTTVLSSFPANTSTISVTQTSTQLGKTITSIVHSTSPVSSSVRSSPTQFNNSTTTHATNSTISVTNTPIWKNSTTAKPTDGETYPTGCVSTVPVGNVTSTVWTTSKPSASASKFPTSTMVPLSNSAFSVASPASGLSVVVSTLVMFFLFLSGRLNAINGTILVLDATFTKSMLVVAFVTAYCFFGGLATVVGGTTIGQFLAVY